MVLEGRLAAEQVALLKFGLSGKLATIRIKVGDLVKTGQLLATLDKTELQMYLDRELKEYDLERANFDAKQNQNLTEYEKRKCQDSLDISVKNVEIAKINLASCDLVSSINGVVSSMDKAQAGENITPAGFVIKVVNPQSLYFEAEIPETELRNVELGKTGKVVLEAYPEKVYEATIQTISYEPTKDGSYLAKVSLELEDMFRLGLRGKLEI